MAHDLPSSTTISIFARFIDELLRRLWGTVVEKFFEVLIAVGALLYSLQRYGFSRTVLREHLWEALAPIIYAFSVIIIYQSVRSAFGLIAAIKKEFEVATPEEGLIALPGGGRNAVLKQRLQPPPYFRFKVWTSATALIAMSIACSVLVGNQSSAGIAEPDRTNQPETKSPDTHVAVVPTAPQKAAPRSSFTNPKPVTPHPQNQPSRPQAALVPPPAITTQAAPASVQSPCEAGTRVQNWTIEYSFPPPAQDPKATADPTTVFVSVLDLNVSRQIQQTAAFKKAMANVLMSSDYLRDEQKSLIDALNEIKASKGLLAQPQQTSFGTFSYRYRRELIRSYHPDSHISIAWTYVFQGIGNAADSEGKGPFPLTDFSRNTQAAFNNLNLKLELQIDDACNRGEAELYTSPQQ